MSKVIVVGGGLSGCAAAHSVLQSGGQVVLLDKNAFMGGNSTKATSGINGSETKTQKAMGINDSNAQFLEDSIRGATGQKDLSKPCPPTTELFNALVNNSGPGIQWLEDSFGLKLDTVSRLGGHTYERTHRSKSGGKFPGMMITYALMEALEQKAASHPDKARVICRATATNLLTNPDGSVAGIEFEQGGKTYKEYGSVVLASGGFGAGGLTKGSFLERVRPELMHLPTTNGSHCTGDGIRMVVDIGGGTTDIDQVQVHPTGIINPYLPDERTLFLAAEALRGEGGIILDCEGNRFCNDLGTRDYVSGMMWKQNKAPYTLVLNQNSSNNIAWHCKHYVGRKIMRELTSGAALAKEIGCPVENLEKTFGAYNNYATNGGDPWGKKFFSGAPLSVNDSFHVATVTPVVHYTMGGVSIDADAAVLRKNSTQPIGNVFAGGEVTGGVHGKNRLGGSALLECVVYGRIAGISAAKAASAMPAKEGDSKALAATIQAKDAEQATAGAAAAEKAATSASYSLEQVAKHTSEEDCWVVVDGQVLDVTTFLDDHPGGKMAIMAFAGRDATEEFNMVHEEGVVAKYAAHTIIGALKAGSKL